MKHVWNGISLVVLCILVLMPGNAVSEESLRMATFHLPLWVEDEERGGFIELTKTIAERAGVELDIQLMPTKQAVRSFREQQFDILFPAVDTVFEDGDSSLNTSERAALRIEYIFTRNDKPVLTTFDDLKGKTVGLILGFPYPKELIENPEIRILPLQSYTQNAYMLIQDRLDAFVAEPFAATAAFRELGVLDRVHYDETNPLIRQRIFYAFQETEQGQRAAEQFSTILREMTESGELTRILTQTQQRTAMPPASSTSTEFNTSVNDTETSDTVPHDDRESADTDYARKLYEQMLEAQGITGEQPAAGDSSSKQPSDVSPKTDVPPPGKNLTIAVGLALPPYVIPDDDSGIETDIVREGLKMNGHTLTLDYVPFARVPETLRRGRADGALTVNEASGLDNVFFSDSHVTYQNVVVSLQEANLKIENLADLQDKRIVAFQNATVYLGPEFAKMAAANPKYRELADQESQIVMLYKHRADVIVLDVNIFKYYRQNTKMIDTSAPVVIHELFPPTYYKVGFLDEQIRDQFNDALAEMKRNGRYEAIIKRYIHE